MTDEKIIGYDLVDNQCEPIYELKKGYVYTAALIICRRCSNMISGMGGPRFKPLCVNCEKETGRIKNETL